MSKLAIHYGKPLSFPNPYVSLADMFLNVTERYPQQGMRFFETSGEDTFLTYPELINEAWYYLHCLRQQGVNPGDVIILIVNHDLPAFYKLFWACILGGIVIAPVSQPSFENDSATLTKLRHVWQILKKPLVVVEERYRKYFTDLETVDGFAGFKFLSATELQKRESKAALHYSASGDLAILQFSSGSTGYPKGVQLTHNNILTNLFAMHRGFELSSEDQVFTWLPHTHDMGLFFQFLSPLAKGCNLYVFSPMTFTRTPYLFLKKITEYRGSWFGSPNFGLDWMIKSISEEQLASLDLSSLRFVLNGAEPISASVMQAFYEKFSTCGLQENRMRAAYGMAEVTVCATVTPLMQPMQIDVVDRDKLINESAAQPPLSKHIDQFSLVHVGYPVDEISLRIADASGKTLLENQVGEIQIQGPSVTCGYFNHECEASELFVDGWLHTGDLGYMQEGSLVIVGRMKDILFVRGQNYFAHDLEETLFKLGIVPRGNLLIIGQHNHQTGQEEVVVFVKHKARLDGFLDLKQRIQIGLRTTFGIEATHVLPVGTIAKTTSGKLQRNVLQKKYQRGEFSSIIVQLKALVKDPKVCESNHATTSIKIEKKLRQIWSEILNVPEKNIATEDNFFALGGNSLKAFQLLESLSKYMQRDIDPEMLSICSTIRQIVDYLQSPTLTENSKFEVIRVQEIGSNKAIAITGMAFKLPGADTQQALWKNLAGGKNNIQRISAKRKKLANDPEWNDWMAALENIDYFDDVFFGIPQEEAQFMDPQQRLTLEAAYHALEDAGLTQKLEGEQHVGVYSGTCMNTYLSLITKHIEHTKDIHKHALVSNLCNVIPARISSFFNFTGPSLTIDTACSSFLVTLHHAALALKQSSLAGALVTSSNILVTPEIHALSRLAGILSEGDKVKVFDHKACGTVLGEGVLVFYLERLEDALKHNKHIYGVIKGSAVNNDGGSYTIMAPNPNGQYQVLEKAYQDAGVSLSEISYLEVHGTGTVLGDFIEVNTLSKLFTKDTQAKPMSIGIGSAKTNMGHLLPAAGAVGLAKILLGFKHQQLVPNLNFRKPNPLLNIEKSPFYVVDQLKPWEVDAKGKRIAGLSSFGLGGTNAHVVIEEWNNYASESLLTSELHLLTLSAKTQTALQCMDKQMKAVLVKNHDLAICDICYTRNRYRKHYDYRAAYLIADDTRRVVKAMYNKQVGGRQPTIALIVGELPSTISQQTQHWIKTVQSYLKNPTVVLQEDAPLVQSMQAKVTTFDILLKLGKMSSSFVSKYCHDKTEVIRVSIESIVDPDATLLSLMANLYISGVNFNWEVVYPNGSGKIVHLPPYPFESRSHWVNEIKTSV